MPLIVPALGKMEVLPRASRPTSNMPLSPITDFYSGDGPDHRGRSLKQLQTQTLDSLERNHDYIQWLFPLPEPSSANAQAPVLSQSDIAQFAQSDELRHNLLESFLVMLRFYGFELVDSPQGVEVRRSAVFAERSKVWLTPFNHNFLRITRILSALSLLGCKPYAAALFRCLEGVYREYADVVGPETFRYWESARR